MKQVSFQLSKKNMTGNRSTVFKKPEDEKLHRQVDVISREKKPTREDADLQADRIAREDEPKVHIDVIDIGGEAPAKPRKCCRLC